jgi:hypothetical protein
VELYVASKVKGVAQAIAGDVPRGGQLGLHNKIGIEGNQTIEYLHCDVVGQLRGNNHRIQAAGISAQHIHAVHPSQANTTFTFTRRYVATWARTSSGYYDQYYNSQKHKRKGGPHGTAMSGGATMR